MSDLYTGVFGRSLNDNDHGPRTAYDHFVPEGWDEINRGICPRCGKPVSWNEAIDQWMHDPTLTVLILTRHEMDLVLQEDPSHEIRAMHELNHP